MESGDAPDSQTQSPIKSGTPSSEEHTRNTRSGSLPPDNLINSLRKGSSVAQVDLLRASHMMGVDKDSEGWGRLKKPEEQGSKPSLLDVVSEANRKKTNVEASIEEHWSSVMVKLAPKGYNKMPSWQKTILDRVIKSMSLRETHMRPLQQNLSASASEPTLEGFGDDRDDLERQMSGRSTSSLRNSMTSSGLDVGGKKKKYLNAEQSRKQTMADRQNQIHFYTSCIQTGQLVQQELVEANSHMDRQIKDILKLSQGTKTNWQQEKAKLKRQSVSAMNRCQQMEEKSNEMEAYSRRLMRTIDDLRKTRQTYKITHKNLKTKEVKMKEDMQFVAQATQMALDQRQKFRSKLAAMRRDCTHERENKGGDLKKLADKLRDLDQKHDQLQESLDLSEERKKIDTFASSKIGRTRQLKSDARLGYLQNQVKGWDREFAKMQVHSGMDQKFEPGQPQIIEELLSKFEVHEVKTASHMAYLEGQGEQIRLLQKELSDLQEAEAALLKRKEEIEKQGAGDDEQMWQRLAKETDEKLTRQDKDFKEMAQVIQETTLKFVSDPPRPSGELPPALEDLILLENTTNEVLKRAKGYADNEDMLEERRKVYRKWTEPRTSKQAPGVTEIHRQLVSQAAQQQQFQYPEDDEEEAEKNRMEEAKSGPFARHKVDASTREKSMQSWLKKRNAPAGAKGGEDADEHAIAEEGAEQVGDGQDDVADSLPQKENIPLDAPGGVTAAPMSLSALKSAEPAKVADNKRIPKTQQGQGPTAGMKKNVPKQSKGATLETSSSASQLPRASALPSNRQNMNAMIYILGSGADAMEAKDILTYARKGST